MVYAVYSFICGCRRFHEMEIPIMENCLSSVTLASAVIMAIFIFIYGSVAPVLVFINSAVI